MATPHYLRAANDSTAGYRAEDMGLIMGGTRSLSKDLFLGIYSKTSRLEVDYMGEGIEHRWEEMVSHSLGGHLFHRFHEDWIFSGIGSLYYTETDYRDMDVNNRESAIHDAWSARLDTQLTYLARLNDQMLLPHLGLSGVWFHREAFTTANLSGPDVHYGKLEEIEAFGKLGIKYLAEMEIKPEWEFKGFAGTGILHTLSDGSYSNTMTAGSVNRRITRTPDQTTWNVEAGLEISHGRVSMDLGYNGEYSSDNRNALFWFQCRVRF